MDITPNHHRIKRLGPTHEELPEHISNGASSSSTLTARKRWYSLMPLVVVLVLIAEMGFLGRLDMAKNAALLADSLYQLTTSFSSAGDVGIEEDVGSGVVGLDRNPEAGGCEEWLMREDSVVYSRDFEKEPVLVSGDQEAIPCAVGCNIQFDFNKKPDAMFGVAQQPGTANVLRSMESSHYYPQNNIDLARRKGYNIVMTTSLSSDVPVGYFSWVEYDIMAPPQAKTEKALAAAFISNCGSNNFRLQALEALEKANVSIDSYGSCHRNRDGRVDKEETLKRYKFSLAFENSNEEDYVTEKFFQSLLSGCVPVVIGAPNILDFAPSPDSIIHIRELEDVESVAKTMKYLAENSDAYNQSVRWKFEGPSDSFKALVDMAAVHSSCRLCIYLATTIREKEEQTLAFRKRPCKCTRGLETVYHVYVRERGRFEMESIFLRSSNMTLEALESAVLSKFKALKHVPIWKLERPKSIRGGNELRIYRIYPIGKTQREALYTFRFGGNAEFRSHIERNPCPKFEVIFV